MPSYRRILYHLIFRTKHSRYVLDQVHSRELYVYIHGILKSKKCHLYRINGVENHVHLLFELHPSLALADFVKDLKVYTSLWLKRSGKFPDFRGWAVGYGAFTYSIREKDTIINYIKNQQKHHQRKTFEEEYRRLVLEAGIVIDEKYFP
jgi:REP element-mobilizing transposase RayT